MRQNHKLSVPIFYGNKLCYRLAHRRRDAWTTAVLLACLRPLAAWEPRAMTATAIHTGRENPSGHNLVIQVENVSKLFRTPNKATIGALHDISLSIADGEFVTVVGPSGCGKSTLLKLIAGLSAASAGRILYQGAEVRGLNTNVGYVPQESKLFPWLTVKEKYRFWSGCQTLLATGSRASSPAFDHPCGSGRL